MAYEGLRQAIAFEEEGRKFYSDAAARATNPLVAKLFASLAIAGIEHRLRLEAALEGMVRRVWWEPGTGAESGLEEVVRSYFCGVNRDRLKENLADAGNSKALEAAMEIGRRGLAMYERFIAESGGQERALFTALRKEQGDHLVALENVHRYLTQPAGWLNQEKSCVWNWMTP